MWFLRATRDRTDASDDTFQDRFRDTISDTSFQARQHKKEQSNRDIPGLFLRACTCDPPFERIYTSLGRETLQRTGKRGP